MMLDGVGQIVILNGPPRSGKSSIATVIQEPFDGVWMNLGVDRFKQMTPDRFQPGIGLRPGASGLTSSPSSWLPTEACTTP
jgi:chloramphenicol 3-O phosphotransferase